MGLLKGFNLGKALMSFADAAPIAQATLNGDYAGASQARSRLDQRRTDRAENDRLNGVRTDAYNYLVNERGVDPKRARVMTENLSNLSQEFNTTERTRELGEGQSIAAPRLGGGYDLTTAPKTFQHGADVMRIDGQGPPPSAPRQTGPQSYDDSAVPSSKAALAMPAPPPSAPRMGQPGASSWSMRTDAEQYADQMAPRDKPAWATAMQDYTLKGNGPTATGLDEGLEGVRQRNRVSLRGVPTFSATHPRPSGGRSGGGTRPSMAGVIAPILAKVSRGQPLSAGEQSAYEMWKPRRHPTGGAPASQGSPQHVATDGKGNKVGWNGSAWVPLR